MSRNLICDICGKKPFKTVQGLVGHKRIIHNVWQRTEKIIKHDIMTRLDRLEGWMEKVEGVLDRLANSEAARSAQWIVFLEYVEKGLSKKFGTLPVQSHEEYLELVEKIKKHLKGG